MATQDVSQAHAELLASTGRRVSVSVRTRTTERGVSHVLARRPAYRATAAALAVLLSDPKYRKYVSQVDKCLTTLENVHEWADFIAFLTKLLKTFQANAQFKEIPRKLIVAKRLAQCLNSALPAGVHQRALDVYAYILAIQGVDGLERDLQLWSTGLLPFFEYAATSVKPTLMNIYETYYLALDTSLRPITKSFMLALFPGLEEEGGEFFEKTLSLLDRISQAVSHVFFLQNVWLVMLTAPAGRASALIYLARRLPKIRDAEDIATVVGGDVGLMIRAFSACLEDENLLVRRGTLDLLVQALKLDGAVLKRVQGDDRTILMRAATNVVLRRDLSLNRRLYSWLLGSDESSDAQSKHLKEWGIDLLCVTLKAEMFECRPDAFDSRPFKIFISLLDKWEIGAPLTDAIVIDALRALRRCVTSVADADASVLLTASTVVEAADPIAVWRQMYRLVHAEITSNGMLLEALPLAQFTISTIRNQDDEVEGTHLALMFGALAEQLKLLALSDRCRASAETTRGALKLLADIFPHIPIAIWTRSPTAQLPAQDAAPHGPYATACRLYGVALPRGARHESKLLLVSAFEDLATLSQALASTIFAGGDGLPSACECLMHCLTLLLRIVRRPEESVTCSVAWSPLEWLNAVLACLDQKMSFGLIDCIVTLAVGLASSTLVEPKLVIDERTFVSKMVSMLVAYLGPEHGSYHVRSVHLVWALEQATSHQHVESTIAQLLTTPEPRKALGMYNAFGVLWRLTDEHVAPGFRLKIPMLLVLDTLKSDDPGLRRTGETWMRCCLRSYTRVLDPVLFDLLDPNIRRQPAVSSFKGKGIGGFTYEAPFDQHRLDYLIDTLLSLIRFGGQSFGKITRGTPIKRSLHQGFIARAIAATNSEATYMDVLVATLLLFLQSEPKPSLAPTMGPGNVLLQSSSLELLQAIISHGEADKATLEIVESVFVGKLFISVHTDRLDLQNKLLHGLHSVFFAESPSDDRPARAILPRAAEPIMAPDDAAHLDESLPALERAVNPLLMQALLDGLTRPSNRPILQHWLDFISMTAPHFQNAPQHLIFPLIECMCRQLRAGLADMDHIATTRLARTGDVLSHTTDAEFIMLLNSLERLLLVSFAKFADISLDAEEAPALEKSTSDASGIFGLVSNVFGAESAGDSSNERLSGKTSSFWFVREAIQVLYATWVTTTLHGSEDTSDGDSLALICSRAKGRGAKVLERLFRSQPTEVLESIVECWSATPSDTAVFDVVDFLAPSAQTVVNMLCESIACRVAASDKGRRPPVNPNLCVICAIFTALKVWSRSEKVLFQFLEEYLGRLEGPIVIQVWARCLALGKEVTSGGQTYRQQLYLVLRCITVACEKLVLTTALEDRRLRRDLQDMFVKLVDANVMFTGKSLDQRSWIGRATRDSLITNGRNSPGPKDVQGDEKPPGTPMMGDSASILASDVVDQLSGFLASNVLPLLRRILLESDKISSLCTNIVYYIVNPMIKGKSNRSLDVDESILDVLREMTKLPAAAKAWRGPVMEAFADSRFFNTPPQLAGKWGPLVRALMDTDKQALSELIAKITSTPSANIFTNRESEMQLRAQNFRRLSYVLFTGDKNTFLAHLPSVQEKIVDILKNVSAPVVQSEVYLCMRVLLCRLSPHNLASSWPVLVTEMLRIFEQVMSDPPADGSEELPLILAACKFVDLLLVLQTEEFQVHEWMFVTDTVDAIYRPDDWFPESLLDQLAEIIGDLPMQMDGKAGDGSSQFRSSYNAHLDPETPGPDIPLSRKRRRPLLAGVPSIASIRELIPFFSNISIQAYEGVYASVGGANVDWDTVESGLLAEIFDGR